MSDASARVKRVLVIDDDSALLVLMQRVMAMRLPEVVMVGARSLADARQVIAADGLPDLVLADIHLPNGDGRHLREELAGIPFVVTSGDAREVTDLPKPF